MRILILNQPIRDKGDYAAHRALCRGLKRNLSNISITCLLPSMNDVPKDQYYVDNVNYHAFDMSKGFFFSKHNRLFFRMFFILKKTWMKYFWSYFRKVNDLIKTNDVVICAPGGIDLGGYMSYNHPSLLLLAKLHKKPIMYYSRSIGPFNDKGFFNKDYKKKAIEILKYCSYVGLRDGASIKLATELDIPCNPSIDTVFLEQPQVNIPKSLKESLGDDYIVFVPNKLNWHYKFRNLEQKKIDNLYISFLDEMSSVCQNTKIVMLPIICDQGENGDETYFRNLAQQSKNENIFILDESYDSDVQQTIIARAKVVVGSRYHSVVFPLNYGVPFVSLSYEHKMTGLLEMLGKTDRSLDLLEMTLPSWNSIDFVNRMITLVSNAKPDTISAQKAHSIALSNMYAMIDAIKGFQN